MKIQNNYGGMETMTFKNLQLAEEREHNEKIVNGQFKSGFNQGRISALKEVEKIIDIMEWRGGHHTTFDLETKPLMDMIDKTAQEITGK